MSDRVNNCESAIYLNALNRIIFLGAKRISTLLECYGTPRKVWEAPTEEIIKLVELKKSADQFDCERKSIDPLYEWKRLLNYNVNCITLKCPGYPSLLKEIPLPPPILYYRGNLEEAEKPAVAIVGSRRCTFYGKETAGKLAEELTSEGITVVSGMALGIDTAAHRGVLDNSGFTIAVLGCSLDKCYPPQNKDLKKEIEHSGLVISEYPLGSEPLPYYFPQRNRIISGLSLATVVIEATAKSGALITANYALEQNREVFAVPGNIGSPYSRGCHRLIKEGAGLVESAADILDALYMGSENEYQLSLDNSRQDLTEVEKRLLDIIPYQPLHLDNIIRLCGLKASEASAILLSLELKKCIRQTPGKFFSRI